MHNNDVIDNLHKTFDKILRNKSIATSPSRHEKDFGAYVMKATENKNVDWYPVDRMPNHIKPGDDVSSYVKNWVFPKEDVDIMRMAVAMAKIAEANDVGANQFSTMFTLVCRMMKVEGIWVQ